MSSPASIPAGPVLSALPVPAAPAAAAVVPAPAPIHSSGGDLAAAPAIQPSIDKVKRVLTANIGSRTGWDIGPTQSVMNIGLDFDRNEPQDRKDQIVTQVIARLSEMVASRGLDILFRRKYNSINIIVENNNGLALQQLLFQRHFA